MSSNPHILAVDDDPDVRSLIVDYLSENGMRVSAAANGTEMRALMDTDHVDLILLDVKLPGADGFTLARDIRAHPRTALVPIIMLTGQSHEVDRVLGLELGADDYLTKPFSPRELLARIKAVLRRYEIAQPPTADAKREGEVRSDIRTYRFSSWSLSTGTRKLTAADGRKIDLTNGEYALLIAFLKAPRRVLSRDQLLESSRLHDDIYDRTIDVQILRLRRKIEADPNQPRLIRTERGAGYVFDSEVQS
jgi:DNA-binding response OmpR family regulator